MSTYYEKAYQMITAPEARAATERDVFAGETAVCRHEQCHLRDLVSRVLTAVEHDFTDGLVHLADAPALVGGE